ncbi:3-hydroxyacyl-CoA dehydrogenase, partial [Klebsiella pneumoniae]|uniref:3-hydroxyacyl-CoA dehydrogenase NAD-binding domain-containing protein n=1 Tax=Klebsiella pneumoniae TaxID=573 RepID=UPI003904D7D3|nr:3-hydroxyacyl-CoA dehydrogenase [Klebsiella pneumoniae]
MEKIIGVVGAGTMGNGIAQTAAKSGFGVVLCDVSRDFVDRGIETIIKSLERFIKKEIIT